jgi:hypothetical protein
MHLRKGVAPVRTRVLTSASRCACLQQTLADADVLRPAVRLAMAGLGEQAQALRMRPRANSAPAGGGLCGV